MRVYKGSFRKKNGELREMTFAKLDELPDSFLEQKIVGSGSSKNYPAGMSLVWDIEEDNFRVFNWSTVEGSVEELNIDTNYYNG